MSGYIQAISFISLELGISYSDQMAMNIEEWELYFSFMEKKLKKYK